MCLFMETGLFKKCMCMSICSHVCMSAPHMPGTDRCQRRGVGSPRSVAMNGHLGAGN